MGDSQNSGYRFRDPYNYNMGCNILGSILGLHLFWEITNICRIIRGHGICGMPHCKATLKAKT